MSLTALSLVVVSTVSSATLSGVAPDPETMARRVDEAIYAGLEDEGIEPAPVCNDEDFLRRVTLDLTAQLPDAGDITRFGIDGSDDKRGAAIDRLVNRQASHERWSRYWTETIYSRATNARSVVSRGPFEQWLTGRLAENTPWDEIVTEMVTATGDIRGNGATGFLFAHDGDAAEVASETARLFTGIQMSCANCHDHPSDQWKRTQFHQLAAYFPRVRVRTDRSSGRPQFSIASQDSERGGPEQRMEALFRLDRNRDGKLTTREVSYLPRAKDVFERILGYADSNGDDALTREEAKSARPPQGRNQDLEHFMADLDDPTSKGDRMQPVFFVTRDRVPVGATDEQRRTSLARSLTSTENAWFAKSLVNRYWHELVGEGFYMPVDDLGPGREAMMPEALDLLSGGFIRSGYDLHWLLQTITRTDAYQRSIREPDTIDYTAGSSALAATRLDADQIYGALRAALNVTRLGTRGQRNIGPYSIPSFERQAFSDVFGEDPSTPKADVLGSIPQALAMMNSSFIERGIAANGRTRLADLLETFRDNRDVTTELYIAVLGREPNAEEVAIAISYLNDVGNRNEAFEDIYWALINSAEFINRR